MMETKVFHIIECRRYTVSSLLYINNQGEIRKAIAFILYDSKLGNMSEKFKQKNVMSKSLKCIISIKRRKKCFSLK